MHEWQPIGSEDFAEFDTTIPYLPDPRECMSCGLCLKVCPTAQVFQSEAESPRQRIRTLSKLLVENLPISIEERQHLDNCVQCRACETACPSKMPFGQLFDQAHHNASTPPPFLARVAFYVIRHRHWLGRLMPGVALYLKSGLQKPLRASGLLKKIGLANAEALVAMPALRPFAEYTPASTETRGTVALFTGCVTTHFDQATLRAAIKVLNAIGYAVTVPKAQECCGAIHQHNGQSATSFIAQNIQVFNALNVDAVLHCTSGCGAMLSEYQSDDTEAAERFRSRLYDANEFILKHWPQSLALAALNRTVAVHEPCSQRNVLHTSQAVYALLAKIPGLTVTPLADNHLCCGAGGAYMLTHPDNAAALRSLKYQRINTAAADTIVSSNYGCALFLRTPEIKIEHPLNMLAKQL